MMTPLKFKANPKSLSSSKKLVIHVLKEERVKHVDGGNRPKTAHSLSLAIKLNNFLQWSAAGCVLPYLSVYFLRYTQADSSHVGLVMALAAIVGTLLNFLLGSLSDRYQAHRQFYLISLLLGYLSISIMFVPIFKSASTLAAARQEEEQSTHTAVQTTITNDTIQASATALPVSHEDLQTIDQQQPVWLYLIGACIAFGSLCITSNQIFSDSFSANMARQCSTSFGSLRFYGALGWCVSNFILSTANSYLGDDNDDDAAQWSPSVPYLLPGWTLFALLSGANIALIMCWPDKRPFDLSSSSSPSLDIECGQDTCDKPPLPPGKPVVLVRAELLTFDALEERAAGDTATSGGQNMRRCSIAPLGSSHFIQQFEIEPPPPPLAAAQSLPTHFKHITKVEPLEADNQLEQQIKMFQNQQQQVGEYERTNSGNKRPKSMSLRLHIKIIELIARRNSNLVRCMALYAVVGFVISNNWNFLFPYLELLDASKFLTISGYVMVSTYASETVFYYFSPWITRRVGAVNGLSVILAFLALRFSAYLAFTASSSHTTAWPLELMIVVESLQSVTMGWFDCIFSEQALEFALEAEACVPRLIELGLMEDTREARQQVTNGVKLSLMSLSSCFFDGVGVSIGSLIGGWLVGTFSFAMLWLVCVSIALAACAINVVLELSCSKPKPDRLATRSNEPGENKYQT